MENADALNPSTVPPSTEPASAPAAPSPKRKKRFSLKLAALVAVVVLVVAMTAFVYTRPPTDSAVRRIVSVVPYPAVVVNGQMVPMEDYLVERDALANYFAMSATADGQPVTAPSEEELSTNILETLVNKTAIEQIAKQRGITLDEARVDSTYQEAVAPAGGEDVFADQLQQTFGWTTDQFRERVINSVVLALQVSEAIAADKDIQAEAKTKADGAAARLDAGEDFATVAGDTSEDSSAAQGGDLGYLTLADLDPAWAEAVDALEVGQHTAVLETDESYVIFGLTDRIEGGDATKYKLSAIVVNKKTLKEVVDDYIAHAHVWKLVKQA